MSHYTNNPFSHMHDPLNPHQQHQSQFNQQPGSFAQRVHHQQQPQMGQYPQYNQLGGIPPGLSMHQQEMWRQQHQHQQRQGPLPHVPSFNVNSHYSSGREVINNNRLMEFKNTVKVLKLADDDELGYYFMLDPAYVYTLLQPKLNPWSSEVKGIWFEDTGYGTVTADSELVLSTPLVTFTIGRGSCKITYAKPDEVMSDDDIVDGVLPILRYIKSEYEAVEEVKRQRELERLKEVERLRKIHEARDGVFSELEMAPKRDLQDTEHKTPKGQIKKNTASQMSRLRDLIESKVDGGYDLLTTPANELESILANIEGKWFAVIDKADDGKAALFLKPSPNGYSDIRIMGADIDITLGHPNSTVWGRLDYANVDSYTLLESLRLIALLIRYLLEHNADLTNDGEK